MKTTLSTFSDIYLLMHYFENDMNHQVCYWIFHKKCMELLKVCSCLSLKNCVFHDVLGIHSIYLKIVFVNNMIFFNIVSNLLQIEEVNSDLK